MNGDYTITTASGNQFKVGDRIRLSGFPETNIKLPFWRRLIVGLRYIFLGK